MFTPSNGTVLPPKSGHHLLANRPVHLARHKHRQVPTTTNQHHWGGRGIPSSTSIRAHYSEIPQSLPDKPVAFAKVDQKNPQDCTTRQHNLNNNEGTRHTLIGNAPFNLQGWATPSKGVQNLPGYCPRRVGNCLSCPFQDMSSFPTCAQSERPTNLVVSPLCA